jgi:hypothetical protein
MSPKIRDSPRILPGRLLRWIHRAAIPPATKAVPAYLTITAMEKRSAAAGRILESPRSRNLDMSAMPARPRRRPEGSDRAKACPSRLARASRKRMEPARARGTEPPASRMSHPVRKMFPANTRALSQRAATSGSGPARAGRVMRRGKRGG